jgi:hypothetical protein
MSPGPAFIPWWGPPDDPPTEPESVVCVSWSQHVDAVPRGYIWSPATSSTMAGWVWPNPPPAPKRTPQQYEMGQRLGFQPGQIPDDMIITIDRLIELERRKGREALLYELSSIMGNR